MRILRGLRLAAAGFVMSCSAGADLPTENVGTTEQPVIDPELELAANCSSTQNIVRSAHNTGMVIARTREFKECIINPLPDISLARSVPGGATRNYLSCNAPCFTWNQNSCGDDEGGKSTTMLFRVAERPNQVEITCGVFGARGRACNPLLLNDCPGVLHSQDEEIEIDDNFALTANPSTNPQAARPWPWNTTGQGFSEVAGTIWHEILHTHHYSHGGDSDQNSNCGRASAPVAWHWRRNAATAVVQNCMMNLTAGRGPAGDGAQAPGPYGQPILVGPPAGQRTYRYPGDNITDRFLRQYAKSGVNCVVGASGACTNVDNGPGSPTPFFDAVGARMAAGTYNPDDIVRDVLGVSYARAALDTGGDIVTPSGITTGEVTGTFGPEIVIAGIDTVNNPNYWRYRLGRDCAFGGCVEWGPPIGVSSDGAILTGGSVHLADFSGDGRADILLSGVDKCGEGFDDACDDYFRYRILSNCDGLGNCAVWSPIRATPQLANGTDLKSSIAVGAGAVGDLDSNNIRDIVFAGVDKRARGGNQWLFAIGRNCNADGDCAGGWSTSRIPIGSFSMTGAGVAIGDLDGDGVANEIIISGTDSDLGSIDGLKRQGWRYVIGRCPGIASQCVFGPPQTVESEDNMLEANWGILREGNTIATTPVSRLSTVRGDQVVLSGAVTFFGLEARGYTLTRAGRACNLTTGTCEFGPSRSFETGVRDFLGGQIAQLVTSPNNQPSLVYGGIDHRASLADHFFYGIHNPPQGTMANEQFGFGPYDVDEANLRATNDSMAGATRIGIPSNQWTYQIDRAAGACPPEMPSCANDVDFYVFDLPFSQWVDIKMFHPTTAFSGSAPNGDIDIDLLNASGALIARSAVGAPGGWVTESITRNLSAGRYFIKVYGFKYSGSLIAETNFYVMRVQ